MSSTSAPTTNPVLEFRRRKRTRSNLSVFTLPTSLAKRPHIQEIPESGPSARLTFDAPAGLLSETETSSSSASSDVESSDEVSDDESDEIDDTEGSGLENLQSETDSDQSEETSSSSSSSSGSLSASPSPSPTVNPRDPIGLSNIPHASLNTITSAVPPPSSLTSRLQAFLPAMKSANEQLEVERAEGTLDARDIENIGQDSTAASGHIEMNLGLGVLEQKQDGESDSESDTDSESSSDITEPLEKPEASSAINAGSRAKSEKDILGKLKGEPRRERPAIEVLEDNV